MASPFTCYYQFRLGSLLRMNLIIGKIARAAGPQNNSWNRIPLLISAWQC
jgi:hypothetical protein